jgi:hypothetical protein
MKKEEMDLLELKKKGGKVDVRILKVLIPWYKRLYGLITGKEVYGTTAIVGFFASDSKDNKLILK